MSSNGKAVIGGLGALLLTAGVVVTIWGMFAEKDINSVGLASIFLAGIALVYAGIFNVLPEEIGFGDKARIKMQQAVADAVKTVKEAANTEAAHIAQSEAVLKNVVSAKDETAAAVVVEQTLKELVARMPATADVLETLK